MATSSRVEYGDWQTPAELAERALTCVLRSMMTPPRAVVEPTCGEGAFLVAAAHQLPEAELAGYEINKRYVDVTASKLRGARQTVRQADFFSVDWEREVSELGKPILVIGNPPWVTSADLGAMGSSNIPTKRNFKGLNGLDARTGKSNFDVSEWMILRLLRALIG